MRQLMLSVVAAISSMLLFSCSNEDNPQPDNQNDIPPSENILVDDGSVGLVIDTRQIAKKGYQPSRAEIELPSPYSPYSKELEIDPNTNIAMLTIRADSLTDSEVSQLIDGIQVSIVIRDGSSTELSNFDDIVKIDNSNLPLKLNTELPIIYPKLVLDEGTPYLLQVINEDPDANNKLFRIRLDNSFEVGLDAIVLRDFDSQKLEEYSFYFESVNGSDSLYHIKMSLQGYADPFYLRMSNPGNFYSYFVTDPGSIDFDYYRFVVKQDENGMVMIKPTSGNPLGKRITGYDTQVSYAGDAEDYFPLRVVAANVTWTVEDRGTSFNPPILPPARLDFAFKSILKNCSSAKLTETVGRSESQTRSYTVGTEESVELYTSHEASVDVTAGLETEAKLFGQGVTASLEVSVGYKYTTSKTTTTTNTWEETVEETIEVSRVRDVEIPPFTAVEVFDAVQTINNVQMPFVQKLRVRGSYDDERKLSGEEIVSQLLANQFGGVVSNIQDDYVEISVRGTAVIDKFFEVESQVNELSGECDQ